MKVKFNFKMKGDEANVLYPDEATVTSLEKAEEEIKDLIEAFNEGEKSRYGNESGIREFAGLLLPEKLIEEIIEIVLDNVTCEHSADMDDLGLKQHSADYSLDNEKEVMKKCLEAFLKEKHE